MKKLLTYILKAVLLIVFSLIGGAILAHYTNIADAGRENDVWVDRLGTYVTSVFDEGRNVLIKGANKYLNFGTSSGSSGYGFRDNGGDIEYKDSGGVWTAFNSLGGPGGGDISFEIDGVSQSTAFTNLDFDGTDFTITESPADDFDITIASTIARDSELHNAVTLGGEDYLSLSTQLITANAIDSDNLSASDFGDFTCNGTTCAFDADTVAESELDLTAVTLADFTNDAGFVTSADDTVSGTELDGVFSTTGLLKRTGAATYVTVTDTLHDSVTLAGSYDYITIAGQVITRGQIDATTDITGALGIANGGLGAAFTDPNADRLMFWDDSAGAITGIATLSGAAISGTTLTINDVTCTDCLNATELEDIYAFNTGDIVTGVWDFGGATSIEMVNGASPTVDTLGEFALDTTDNQFLIATGTSARAIPTVTKLWGGTVASTSVDFASGGRIALPPHRDGVVITEVHCFVDGGTSKVINLDTMAGGAQLDSLTCATTLTSDTAQSANYSLSAGALMALEFGATTGTVDYMTFTVWGYVKPE